MESIAQAAPPWLRRSMLFLGLWIVLGAYSDTWAHHHVQLTSIVTPFHAVVFSGLACEGASTRDSAR
ncbi:MAG: hypothetical protein ACR2MY_05770 [Candidatus Dormibacteria bacterium]